MPYRTDVDLAFLKYCDDIELKNLADILTYTASGRKRLSSRLRYSKKFRLAQKTGRYTAIWRDIAEELQRCGGNTLMNLIRGGRGIKYRSLVASLCRTMRIDFKRKISTHALEETLTLGSFQRALSLETPRQRKHATADPSLLIKKRRPHWRFFLIMAVLITALRLYDGWLLHHILMIPLPEQAVTALTLLAGPIGIFATLFVWLMPFCASNKRTAMIACVYIAALRKTREMAENDERLFQMKQKMEHASEFSPTFSGGAIAHTSRAQTAFANMAAKGVSMETTPDVLPEKLRKSTPHLVLRPLMQHIVSDKENVKS